MPALIQICIVIATIGVLAIVIMTVRSMGRVHKATEDLSELILAVRASALQFDLFTCETRELVASLRECVPPVLRVVDRFEAVGQRAADLSSALLETLAPPVFTAAAVARGVRFGANHFLNRLIHRFTHRNSSLHGGFGHE